MKKLWFYVFLAVVFVSTTAHAYDFSNTSSVGLLEQAWKALADEDVEAVAAYCDKTVELYGKRAQEMQASLDGYPKEHEDRINSYWALNDVATALYIKGEALFKDNKSDEAKKVYYELINKYKFGQCWDPKGWFWKPAEGAQDRITMIDTGIILEFGDYRSVTLIVRAWEALDNDDLDRVMGYTNKLIHLYGEKARFMQESLSDYPKGADQEIHEYWALNDVATALFIQAEALEKAQRSDEAKERYRDILNKYKYGQCWDPKGWFWKPAIISQQKLAM